MKFLLFILCACIVNNSIAQINTSAFYAASKTGLSLREQPGTGSKVLQKIAYGQKINPEEDNQETVKISTEGFDGYWQKVKYNNQVGYVVSSYLLPVPPPKPAVKTIKDYLLQISQPAGSPVISQKSSMQNIESDGSELKKQLFKNGAEWHEFFAYEYNSSTYFLPDFTIEQAFLIVRLIGAYATELGEKDGYPNKSTSVVLPGGTKTITVSRVNWGEGKEGPVEKITIETAGGPISTLEIFLLSGQAVISWSSGV
jgi:Bacterial SH3 domain